MCLLLAELLPLESQHNQYRMAQNRGFWSQDQTPCELRCPLGVLGRRCGTDCGLVLVLMGGVSQQVCHSLGALHADRVREPGPYKCSRAVR